MYIYIYGRTIEISPCFVPGLAHSTMPEAWRDLQQRCSAVEEMLKRGELEERLGGKPWEIRGNIGISWEYHGGFHT